eukprot:2509926-Rhodomonas_salina.1
MVAASSASGVSTRVENGCTASCSDDRTASCSAPSLVLETQRTALTPSACACWTHTTRPAASHAGSASALEISSSVFQKT